ncbi:MAG: hypothetical protein H0T40_13145 [Geodermatophilaceae bacterium]|nr:hypothetical protein [Geodermatophilaceae bacterium]
MFDTIAADLDARAGDEMRAIADVTAAPGPVRSGRSVLRGVLLPMF